MNQQLVDAKIYSDKLSELNVTNSDKLGELNTTIKLFLQDFKNVFEGILQKAQTSEKALVKVEERVDVLEKVQAEATTTIKNVKVLIGFFGVTTLVGIYEFVDKFLKK